jgi:RNA-splicing ligase RtcB
MTIKVQGKYANCEIMTDDVEASALARIETMMNSPAFEGSTIKIMPGVHDGAGAVIGLTATLTDRVVPNVVGVDISCGVLSINLGHRKVDFPDLDRFIRENIPSGFSVHDKLNRHDYPYIVGFHPQLVERVANQTRQMPDRVMLSLGTLGGGNHFIELGADEDDCLWLTVHTGSRNFGLKIASWHQAVAIDQVGDQKGLEWLEGAEGDTYRSHMRVAQQYAAANRWFILCSIAEDFFRLSQGQLAKCECVESVHNYISFSDNIIRKGAISARKGERVVIPWNMRDGLVIGIGKGNKDWNQSAPHGAGRVMGRGAAKRTLRVEDFRATMTGIWSSCVGPQTLDEAPDAYKPAQTIRDAIGDTVEIQRTVRPLYNFKATISER